MHCVVHYRDTTYILEDHVTSTLTVGISQVWEWPAIYSSLATNARNKLMETNSHNTASVLGGGETWQRLKGKGGSFLPFITLFSPIHLTFFLYFSLLLFNLFSFSFFFSLQKTTGLLTVAVPAPFPSILHTVFPACYFFYSGDRDRKFLKKHCFLRTIYNHIPEAIFWTLMRAPNLASVLSYPSNEIHDILVFMSFM